MLEMIPSDWIDWCADEHPELSAGDFDWAFNPEFPILEIGGQRFVDEMVNWADAEISGLLDDYCCPQDASIEMVGSEVDGRLAGWMQLDKDLSEGKVVEEPVNIALVNAQDANYERNSICDDWHRIAIAIKHKKATIPAYVGTLKNN